MELAGAPLLKVLTLMTIGMIHGMSIPNDLIGTCDYKSEGFTYSELAQRSLTVWRLLALWMYQLKECGAARCKVGDLGKRPWLCVSGEVESGG